MIFRKPYAFLIKNFRLIHLIFAILAGYLFLKGSDILSFLANYISNNGVIIENFTVKELFPTFIPICFIIILLFNIIMIWLLHIKQKKVLFYILNILFYIVLAILFYFMYTTTLKMQTSLIDSKTVRALRDFFVIASIFQILSMFMYGFRATGFDIKKFDFGKDLVSLDIAETDNEEFEFQVNVDIDRINRERRKTLRHIKYLYYENKLVSNCIITIAFLVIGLLLYQSFQDTRLKYNQFEQFTTSDYQLKIGNGYITNQDANGNILSKSKSYVILEVYIKKRTSKTMKLNNARFELVVGKRKYYHDYTNNKYFTDIGNGYYDEALKTEFEKYLLVYKINTKDINKNMYFNYVDATSHVAVKVKFQDLKEEKNTQNYVADDIMNFSDTILDDYQLALTSYGIQKEFTINYRYCVAINECFDAVEYVRPSITSNYNKALLKIKATLTLPEFVNTSITNFESLCNNFGKIKYTIDGNTYQHNLTMNMIKPIKVKQENIYYIEVKEEILRASNVSILFKLRNKTYEYVIK